MRKRHAISLSIVLGLLALGAVAAPLARSWLGHSQRQSVVKPVIPTPLQSYGFDKLKSFAVTVTLKPAPGAREPFARLAFHLQDDGDQYAVEFASDSTTLWRTEHGVRLQIGAPGPSVWPGEHTIVLRRRAERIAVFADGGLVCEAYDGSFHGGRLAVGSYKQSVEFGPLGYQRTADVFFNDGFMRAADDTSDWETVAGQWKVHSLDSPGLSTNAFFYNGKAANDGKPALAVVGERFWDDYRVTTACQPLGEGAFGVCFYYQDPDNYHVFRVGPQRAELVRQRNGRATVLQSVPWGFDPNQWYELTVSVARNRVRAYVDGRLLAEQRDDTLSGGQAGLYATGSKGTSFDDFAVVDERNIVDNFASGRLDGWTQIGGAWTVQDGACTLSTGAPAKLLVGSPTWQRYVVSAAVDVPPSGAAGLVAHYQDERNYDVFTVSDGGRRRELVRVANGEATVLKSHVGEVPLTGRHSLALRAADGFLTATVDGQQALQAWDDAQTAGRAGLYGAPEGQGELAAIVFDGAQIEHLPPPRPLFSVHNVFVGEKSMTGWSTATSDWRSVLDRKRSKTYRWHRSDFFNDVRADIWFDPPISGSGEFKFIVAADKEKPSTGYELRVRGGAMVNFWLYRRGSEIDTARVPGPIDRLRIERRGGLIAVTQHGRMILSFDDDKPLAGTSVAYAAADKNRLPPQNITLSSDSVLSYSFAKAPTDWRVGAGTWKVRNRWECDPRWTWFSGESKQLACLWNKHPLQRDQSVEFYAAIKMNSGRGGGNYRYARDINAALCADGQDLNSGYCFLYGADANKTTKILRKGKVVAEKKDLRISRSIHHRWFHIRATKKGSRVAFYIDDKEVLAYDDPEPLDGQYAAIWTYNVGQMIARARVAAQHIGPREPGFPVKPPTTKCCYTKQVSP